MSQGMTPVLMIRFGWGMFDDIETGEYNDHHNDREIMLMIMMMITWGRFDDIETGDYNDHHWW